MVNFNTRWRLFCELSLLSCALVAAPGCWRSPTVSVTGQITLDGAALPTGTMALIPMDKKSGPSVGCEIVDGKYNIPANQGPLRGAKYRVEIRSMDLSSGSTKNPLSKGVYPVYQDRVPPIYNSESQLTLSVPEDAVRRALDPVENVRVRGVTGGPAPAEVRRMLGERLAALGALQERSRERAARLRSAGVALDAAVRSVAEA